MQAALYAVSTILFIHQRCQRQQILLALLQQLFVMVAQNHIYLNLIRTASYTQRMIEALIAICILRTLACWQRHLPFCRHCHSIAHLVLAAARMHGNALKGDMHVAGVEGFIIQLAQRTAIDGIGELRPKALQRKMLRTAANLFIRREGQTDFAMLDFGMRQKIFAHRNNRADAGLIIRTQQRRAVGRNNILTNIIQQLRKLLRTQHSLRIELNRRAVIIFVQLHLYILAARLAARIHMRNQANNRLAVRTVGRQRCQHIAVFRHFYFRKAKLQQLVYQITRQVKLAQSARLRRRLIVRGCFNLSIGCKAL